RSFHVTGVQTCALPIFSQFVDGRELSRFEHTLPSECPCERLYKRVVGLALRRRAQRELHLLAPAALCHAERDVQSYRVRDLRSKIGRASWRRKRAMRGA